MECRERMYGLMRSLCLYRFPKGETTLVQCELESYLKVLEPLMERIRAVKDNALIKTCSPVRLAEFERMLAIPVNEKIPQDKRREIALSKAGLDPSDFNSAGLQRALDSLGVRAKVEETEGGGTITVTALEMADSEMTLERAKEAFAALMPAHLEAEFVTGGLDFAQFDALGMSFAALDAMDKSWSQLEMMGEEEWR